MTSLSKLRSDLDNKVISACELTELYINRIKKYDKKINSFITLCEENAYEDAKNAQILIDKKQSLPMSGIPIAVKDNITTQGIKTTCASKMLKDFVPFYDATVVKKLKEQNAVIIGKTNMDEFGMGDSNENSYFGAVKNPFNTEYTSGGSSGGSAAAVSAGFAPVSLGTDTGGSVRQPSAFCGVCGLRPSYGTISRNGLISFASSLDQIGICANSAVDTGYLLNCIYGYDRNDMTSSEASPGDYLSLVGKLNSKNIKIGIPHEFYDNIISPEIKKAFLSVVDFYKTNGFEIIETSLPSLKYADAAYMAISSAEASSNLSRYDGIIFGHSSNTVGSYEEKISNSRFDGFGNEVKNRIILGNKILSEENYEKYYISARNMRKQITKEYNEIFKKCDIILSPTSPVLQKKINSSKNDQTYSNDIFTVAASLSGIPEISTVCAYTKENLPIGFSIAAKPYEEAKIIAAADIFEKNFCKKEPAL